MKTTLHIEGTPEELRVILDAMASGITTTDTEEEPVENDEPSEEDLFKEIRTSVAAKSQAGKKEQIKKLLAKYKVTKLPELTTAQYAKFLAEVNKL